MPRPYNLFVNFGSKIRNSIVVFFFFCHSGEYLPIRRQKILSSQNFFRIRQQAKEEKISGIQFISFCQSYTKDIVY